MSDHKKTKKERRFDFFQNHPTCCFCGGNNKATTEDHYPGRSLFRKREWPTGFSFPACQACNAESSDSEVVMAFLSRSDSRCQADKLHLKEFEKAKNSFARQLPELAASLQVQNRVQSRRILKEFGQPQWHPQYGLRYALMIPEKAMDHVNAFGSKLGKALHYKHTERILPVNGTVKVRSFTNAEIPHVNEELFHRLLGGKAEISRNNQDLSEQFKYIYATTEDKKASVFYVQFGFDALNIMIMVYEDENDSIGKM